MKHKLQIVAILLLLFLTVIFYLLTQEENSKNIRGVWRVEHIIINTKDVTNEYSKLYINPVKDNDLIIIPKKRSVKGKYGEAKWRLLGKNLFNSTLEIYDSPQKIFDGKYDIEFSSNGKEKTLNLSSDTIKFFTKRVSLSYGKGTRIELD